MALVIDTCISANLTIKHKKRMKNFICNYCDFQQYVATTPVPLVQTFHACKFENPGSSQESNKNSGD